jgi:pyruvate dehydrogenase E2 component (dihydrolipoamide acetyltransferase)
MSTEVKLPELGENITAGEVVKVLVKVGDTVAVDQPLLELETDKASFDVPSPIAGKVSSVNVVEGKPAQVGAVIFVVDEGNEGKEGKDGNEGKEGKKEQDVSPEGAEDTSPGRETRETKDVSPEGAEDTSPGRETGRRKM